MNRLPRPLALLLIPLALACFALAPQARATCQEGCSDVFSENTFLGEDALINNTTGMANTALGFNALSSNTTGRVNTANGLQALYLNTTGYFNTASGGGALFSNTTGFFNTANGANALGSNNIGHDNTASGNATLFFNTSGNENTAYGAAALATNNTGSDNTACGFNVLRSNTTGSRNTGCGIAALSKNSIGSSNIALGNGAGRSLTTGDHNIDIGNQGVAAEANTIRIGTRITHMNTYIAGINGVTVAGGVGVIVDAEGHLGTTTSSARFKDAVKPMDKASEAIFALRPVMFRYKHFLDTDNIPQFGLVAEDVEKVNPDLVARDEQGKPYTVRYEAVNAMLLNEFLKEHRKVEEQGAMIATQQKQIEALTAGLQKLSAQLTAASPSGGGLELSKSEPQKVVDNR